MSIATEELDALRLAVWFDDIPSPQCQEYVEHHHSIQKILEKIDTQLVETRKAVAKQEPMYALDCEKIIHPHEWAISTEYYWKCPVCGASWLENHYHKYCTDCGQLLICNFKEEEDGREEV